MVMAEELQCLKSIALLRGLSGQVRVSSQSLGKELGISPQTASRRLISLEAQGMITRSIRADGQYIAITEAGGDTLSNEYADYRSIFEDTSGHTILHGIVIDGLGEGRYYVSIPGYHSQFVEKLGFEPFPGTLNIRLWPASIGIRKKLEGYRWVPIEGFIADGRTFGSAKCLPCTIGDYPCAIVVPGRSHYPEDIIEIISPAELRKELGLQETDSVTVEVAT
ncbi:MAG: riboflavin kinase [Methanoculleus sp. SDB]|nr:MAG: riboflavin kinase [Methanoculleus sp. SDB]